MRLRSHVYTVLAVLLLANLFPSPSLAQLDNGPSVTPDALAPGTIYTVAGNGTYSYCGDGSKATVACFRTPTDVTFDKSGNYYIVDNSNCIIRKVVIASNVINTVAGTPAACGYTGDGAAATSAKLNFPTDVRVDGANNLYISDTGNNVIRKVSASGIITTIIGTGAAGYNGDGGPANKAALDNPTGVALAANGNLYIADHKNNVVRIYTAANAEINTFAGTGVAGSAGNGGPASLAELNAPMGLALGTDGSLYIADQGNFVVRKVDTTGDISTFAGSGTTGGLNNGGAACSGGTATKANLAEVDELAFDGAGNLFLSNFFDYGPPYGFSLICKVSVTTGDITLVAGINGNGYNGDGILATTAELNNPYGLAFDGTGDLYLADSNNQRVREIIGAGVTEGTTAAPTFSPAPGTYTAALRVTLADATPKAVIYYTINGTTPTTSSSVYGGSIAVTDTTTIKAIAVAPGDTPSPVVSGTYTINVIEPAATPVITPAAGTYIKSVLVTITDATKGAVIHYTTNGTVPTAASSTYTKPIELTATTTIKAIAIATGFGNSLVASATYVIDLGVTAAPTFSPGTGTYEAEELVTLSDATAGAVIYYTVNGTNPTTASTKYTAPIAVSTTETLRVFAVAPNYEPSAIAAATYTIVTTPSALIAPPTSITASTATLNALVNPGGVTATYTFQYGTSSTALTSTTPQMTLGATSSRVNVSKALTGLKASTKYYYRIVVTTLGGSTTSAVESFTTVTATSATYTIE